MADFFTFFKMVSFFFFLIAELTLAQTFEEEKILPNGVINNLIYFFCFVLKYIIIFSLLFSQLAVMNQKKLILLNQTVK